MKTNFLCRNALPRGSCVFLKMVVTVTALLCIHLGAYAQPMQTTPLNGADVTAPVELQWTNASTQDTDIEVYECTTPSVDPNTVDLGAYELLCDPIAISQVPEDLSGVTYNPLTNTLFMVRNSGEAETIYETTLSGNWLRTINLSAQFDDTEGIVHLGGTEYAVTEERVGRVTLININASTSNVNHSNSTVLQLPGTWSGNDGLEGISYNPANQTIHTLKEKTSKAYYSFSKSASPLMNSNVTEPCGINPFASLIDLAGMHHLGSTNLPNLNVSKHTLILSEDSKTVIEIDENCNQKSQILLSANGANGTLNNDVPQPEGVAMDNNGNLYIVSEPNLLYIFAKPVSGTLIHNTTALSGNAYEIPASLQIGTEYCWRVKSNDECTWSPLWSFTPVDPCSDVSSIGCNDNDDCTINDVKIVSNFDASICVPCAGTPNPSSCNSDCITFQTCDDGDPCTENDLEGMASDGVTVCVPCMGTANPASCDAQCVTVQSCDDGNPLTINDMESLAEDGSICSTCVGVPVAACSDTTIQPCDDGNPCTLNDEETVSNLNGTICIPCMGTTDVSSCDAPCATVQGCDDGNPLTINDMESVAGDGSVCVPCVGTLVNACDYTSLQDCDDGDACTENDAKTVSTLDGSICVPCMGEVNPSSCEASCNTTTRICDDGDPCTKNDEEIVAADGTICTPCAGIINVSSCGEGCDTYELTCDDGNPCTENDIKTVANDGSICVPCEGTIIIDSSCECAVEETCNDGDPLTTDDMVAVATDGTVCEPCGGISLCDIFPPSVRACDDGDDCTENDVEYHITTINGTAICVPCEGTFMDDDSDGVCDVDDVCPNFDDALIGTACDDGNACTINDAYTTDCECEGTLQDSDSDGVCDADDVCPNFDDTLIGTACDDANDCTTNDVYTSDCECVGTLIDEDGNGVCDAEDCPADISISTYDANQTYYEVSNTITTVVNANVEVNNNQQFTLNAGYYVKLTPGFKAKEGSVMRAYIDGCEPSGQKTEQATLASVKHYPNPFKDEVMLEFNLETDAEAQIIVSDVNGRTMSQIPVENLYQGIQTISLSTQSWVPGIYFYQVQIKEQNTGILSHANGTLIKM